MAPLLAQVETPRTQQYTVRGASARIVAVYRSGQSAPVATITAPTGALFVVLGSVLLLLFPWRPYWLYLAGLQLVLGAAMLRALAVGIGWSGTGFVIFDLLNATVYPGVSLAVPAIAYGLETQRDDASSSALPFAER